MYDPDRVHELALQHGFKRRGQRNWVRRTPDFVQLVNLQGSQWSRETNYLNFALWPLAFGDPPSIAESKFHLRMRASGLGEGDLNQFFQLIDRDFRTLDQLRIVCASGSFAGLITIKFRDLLAI